MEGGEEVCWDGKLCIDEWLSSRSTYTQTHVLIPLGCKPRGQAAWTWPLHLLTSTAFLCHPSFSSRWLLHLQSADSKHIMIGLKGMERGAVLIEKKKKSPKRWTQSKLFQLFASLKGPSKHLITTELPISLTFDMLLRVSEGSWVMCVQSSSSATPQKCLKDMQGEMQRGA